MLLSAYQQGIFPWYNEGEPITWHSPDPRFVLLPEDFHLPRRLKRLIKKDPINFADKKPLEFENSKIAPFSSITGKQDCADTQPLCQNPQSSRVPQSELSNLSSPFTYTMNKDFAAVIAACASAKRPKQSGTWITRELISSYTEFHRLGWAHSFETWQNGHLVGGFYGVLIGQVFFGESMFSLVPEATKLAFARFVTKFIFCGGSLIDSQIYTDHIARFGGKNISRSAFLRLERLYLDKPLLYPLHYYY